METLFFIAIRHLGTKVGIEEAAKLFRRYVEYFKAQAVAGELDALGGPFGATIHNVRLFLDQWATPETKAMWLEAIPELA